MIEVSSSFDMNNQVVSKVSNPTAGTDAVNLQTLEARLQGLQAKKAALYTTRANIGDFGNLASIKAALDRQGGNDPNIVAGNRVLVKDQVKKNENGIYFWNGTELLRAEDANAAGELKGGDIIFVTKGDTYADKGFKVVTPDEGVTPGSSEVIFETFTATNTGAGNGLVQNGNDIDVNVDNNGGIELSGDKVKIKLDGDSVGTTANGLKAAVPTKLDKNRPPAPVSTDGGDTALKITGFPAGDGHVQVVIGGVHQSVGDGSKTAAVYFSTDGGSTALPLSSLRGGENLYFNPSIAGFSIDGTDFISLHYNVI